MSHSKRPLEGVKVVELSTFIAGPSCARYLADLGAEVIKVEAPSGDPLRYFAVNEGRPFGDPEDTSFTLENTGKKCVTLNLKDPEGMEAFRKLLDRCDVFITNWRQKPLKKLGIDYESLKAGHPALVMGFVSGYGEKGPDKDLPGFDFTAFFARGGVMGTLYDVDSRPMMPLAGFGDHQAGMYLASGVIAALYHAKMTGEGDQVTVSLLHAALWDTAIYLQSRQYGDPSSKYPISMKKIANQLQVAHKTADNVWVQIGMPVYDRYYPVFMHAMGREDLVGNEKFFPQTNLRDNLEELYAIVDEEIGKRTRAELEKVLKAADIPYAVCQTWDEVLEDPQAWGSDALTKVKFPNGNERTMVRPPVMFTENEPAEYKRAGFLGEHTIEVLKDLGYTDEKVAQMIKSGAAADLKRIG